MQASISDWNSFVEANPMAHIMQIGAWGEFKTDFGWSVFRVIHNKTGAQVLIRNLPMGFKFAYIPKGPVGYEWLDILPEIHQLCRDRNVFFLRIEPDNWESDNNQPQGTESEFIPGDSIQPRRSILVDLKPSEDEIISRMKQKTRYNIRLALKKGIKIERSKDVGKFYSLLKRTGERDQFGIHGLGYYQKAFDYCSNQHACELFLATYQGKPLAGIMVFTKGVRAWYFYGASIEEERERMPTYLLQWEAMRWAKNSGCLEYDLWGVPDEDENTLEEGFMNRSDGLWGVYRFKRGFGGQVMRSAGARDYVYSPIQYRMFLKLLKIRKMQLS
jgi:peptidoglycan pentaglycine glycine transferase (the first glycine)